MQRSATVVRTRASPSVAARASAALFLRCGGQGAVGRLGAQTPPRRAAGIPLSPFCRSQSSSSSSGDEGGDNILQRIPLSQLRLSVPKEIHAHERRVAQTPASVASLVKAGVGSVVVQRGTIALSPPIFSLRYAICASIFPDLFISSALLCPSVYLFYLFIAKLSFYVSVPRFRVLSPFLCTLKERVFRFPSLSVC